MHSVINIYGAVSPTFHAVL